MEPSYIFYSWQSDLPNPTNRGFVGQALEQAAKAIRSDHALVVDPVIDRDTAGVPGAPDIGATIFSKIERSAVFVADVSIINRKSRFRPSPNPNVLIELGYALRALGWQRTVLVANTFFGSPDLLPFDLRQKRVVTYQIAPGNPGRKEVREQLAAALERAFRPILAIQGRGESTRIDPNTYGLDQDLRFKRHRSLFQTSFSMKRERGLLTLVTVPLTEMKVPEARFSETFLDLGRRYSRILNYSNNLPETHPDGYTRRFTGRMRNDTFTEAAVTCYHDGYIVTEDYLEQGRRDASTLNPNWLAYEIQRHLQLSKEVLQGLQEEVLLVVHLEELSNLGWAIYDFGQIAERRPYAGYHDDIAVTVKLSEIPGRDEWNTIYEPIKAILGRVARVFGLRDLPQEYWNAEGTLVYATGGR